VKPQLEKDLKQKKVQEQLDAMKVAVHPTYDDTYFATPPAVGAMKTTPGEATPPTTNPRPKIPIKKQ
jgi:hypothetical protein